jgi:acid phosphatase
MLTEIDCHATEAFLLLIDNFSSVHDGDIAPVLSALHIFDDDHSLPTTHMKTNRTWRASEIMPMGARIIFERMSCQRQSLLGSDETFVRININDGITVLPDCQSGPGQSCPLQEFVIRLDKHQKVAGDFRTVCGLDSNAPEHITFLHQ